PARRGAADPAIRESRGEGIPPEPGDRDPPGSAPRLAPAGEARDHRSRADLGKPGGLRALLLPQCEGASSPRDRPVLLSAEDGKPPGGPPLERGVPVRGECPRGPDRVRES